MKWITSWLTRQPLVLVGDLITVSAQLSPRQFDIITARLGPRVVPITTVRSRAVSWSYKAVSPLARVMRSVSEPQLGFLKLTDSFLAFVLFHRVYISDLCFRARSCFLLRNACFDLLVSRLKHSKNVSLYKLMIIKLCLCRPTTIGFASAIC